MVYIQKNSTVSLHMISPLVLSFILITFFLLKKKRRFILFSLFSLSCISSLIFRSMHLGGPHDLAWIRNNSWILPKAKLIALPQSSNAAHDKDLGTVPQSSYDSTLSPSWRILSHLVETSLFDRFLYGWTLNWTSSN